MLNYRRIVIDKIYLEPGGLVEREGWEVRWAKPIGAVKNIERQRSIDEAAAAAFRGNMEISPASDKSSSRRNRSKGSSKSSAKNEVSDLPKLNYAQILQKFVAEKFQALCHMETLETSPNSGFACKVGINLKKKRKKPFFLQLTYFKHKF